MAEIPPNREAVEAEWLSRLDRDPPPKPAGYPRRRAVARAWLSPSLRVLVRMPGSAADA